MVVHRRDRDEQLRKFEELNREAAELLAELTEPRDIADVEMHKALAMSAIAGSGWEPPAEPSFTLDRAQRAALRRELGVRAYECSDVSLHFDNGNRAAVIRNLEMMGPLVAVMDMIGWQESPEAPELLSMASSDELAAWAARMADELATSLAEAGIPSDPDADLDALGALRSIAGAVA